MFRRKITRTLPVRTLADLGTFVVMPEPAAKVNTFFTNEMLDADYRADLETARAEISSNIWNDVRDVAKHNR